MLAEDREKWRLIFSVQKKKAEFACNVSKSEYDNTRLDEKTPITLW